MALLFSSQCDCSTTLNDNLLLSYNNYNIIICEFPITQNASSCPLQLAAPGGEIRPCRFPDSSLQPVQHVERVKRDGSLQLFVAFVQKRKAFRIRFLSSTHPGGQERSLQTMQLPFQISEEVSKSCSQDWQEGWVRTTILSSVICFNCRD